MDMENVKRVAVRAAYRAGKILNDHFGKALQVNKKGAIDLVTEADLAAEKEIIATIKASFPDHAILAEESGPSGDAGPHCWVVDPLDGTTNFAHRLPIFAVSIAYRNEDDVCVGVVLNPSNGELFSAVKGGGAWLNSDPITVSTTATVGDSLLVTGFPYSVRAASSETILSRFDRCLKAAQGVRRLGSAALDLCSVACGRFDGFWEENLNPWDTAAGMLIAMEAGGRVTDYAGQTYAIEDKQILATNGTIHEDMVALLKIEDTP